MIEHPEKQHQIETAERPDVDVFGRAALILNSRIQRFVRQEKTVLTVRVPRERVDGEDALRTAALAFEREESVPRADVEDGFAGEVVWNLKELQPALEAPAHVPLWTCLDTTEVERVAPRNRADAVTKASGFHTEPGTATPRSRRRSALSCSR